MVRRALVAASLSTGLLLPFAGCTFIVSFDDPDASTSPGTGTSTRDSSVSSSGDDATVSEDAHDPDATTTSDDSSTGGMGSTGDAMSGGDADVEPDATSGIVFVTAPPMTIAGGAAGYSQKPPPGSASLVCTDYCAAYANNSYTWQCLDSIPNQTCDLAMSGLDVVHCNANDSGVGGYKCPTNMPCAHFSTASIEDFCSPCKVYPGRQVCWPYNDSMHAAYKVTCNGDGTVETASYCDSADCSDCP